MIMYGWLESSVSGEYRLVLFFCLQVCHIFWFFWNVSSCFLIFSGQNTQHTLESQQLSKLVILLQVNM